MSDLLAVFAAFIMVFIFIALVFYVIGGLVYMSLGNKAGVQNAWLVWIPFGSWYVKASIAQAPSFVWLAPIALAVGSNMMDGVASFILSVVLLVYIVWIDMKIFARFGENPKLAFLHFIPVIGSLIVFIKFAILAFGNAQAERYI